MYKITIKLPIDFNKDNLKIYVAKEVRLKVPDISKCKLLKLSLDARDKNKIFYLASICFETFKNLNLKKFKGVSKFEKKEINFPKLDKICDKKIVIVGFGPSGMFAGLTLARAGAKVTILERGYEMTKRKSVVTELMKNGTMCEASNIQFGEGGAGTFSDGKLNTGIKSEYIQSVLDDFVLFGANENIAYDFRPHIGTDVLEHVVVNLRNEILNLGSSVLFEHKLVDLKYQNDKIALDIQTPDGYVSIDCYILIFAIGHSSRDTIRMLFDKNMVLKQKPFSMGYRIEHKQSDINFAQYGKFANQNILPPADYHLVTHLDNGRSVYTFCMCPGGVVVPAMSEKNTIVTNGMSYSLRDGENANSAILCTVETSDFPSDSPLAGIELQEEYEKYAFAKNNSYNTTVQLVGDFLHGVPSKKLGKVIPSYRPGYVLGTVEDMLPKVLVDSIKQGIVNLDKKLHGFADSDSILTGVETRSSAPYQVVRNQNMMSSLNNIYMIGEGAGFAGGIMSSAVEGIKCANIIIEKLNN